MNEYALKIDSYYFDNKRKMTMIVIKVRNKRTTNIFSINEIFEDKNALSKLHPIDLCILGIIASKKSSSTNHKRIIDGFSLTKIKPIIEVAGRIHVKDEEVLILRLQLNGEIIKLSLNELYRNKELINALNYTDAIALGYSIAAEHEGNEVNICNDEDEFSMRSLLAVGSMVALIILSAIMCCKHVVVTLFGKEFIIQLGLLFAPAILYIQHRTYKENKHALANSWMVPTFMTYIIFITYYGVIVKIPYLSNSTSSLMYDNLYSYLLPANGGYITILLVASMLDSILSNAKK